MVLYRQGKLDEAIACYRTAIEVDPKFANAHFGLGNALGEHRNVDEAIDSFREAIQINPNWSEAHQQLGYALKVQGKLDEAITYYRKAIELDPTNAPAHHHLGHTFNALGNLDEGIAFYRKAIVLNPKDAELHNNLAWLLATVPNHKFRDPKGAVELSRRAIELVPNEGSYWNTLGIAHYRAAEWNDGIHAMTQSNELMKGEMFSFNAFFLAMSHWQLDEKDEAGKWYKQAVEWMEKNQPENEELERFRAEAAELLGIAETVLPAAEPAVN